MVLSMLKKLKNHFDFDKFMAVYLMVDVCLLPYFRLLSVLPSMLILLVWLAVRIRDKYFTLQSIDRDWEIWAFVFSVLLAANSCLLGLIVLPPSVPSSYRNGNVNIFSQSVIYSVIFVFAFLYYFCCREVYKKHFKLAYATLRIMLAVMFLFSLVYLISPVFFYRLRTFWTMDGNAVEITVDSIKHYRYTFSFSDPNNLAMMAIAITILIAENRKEPVPVRIAVFPMCAIIILASMSVQSVLSLFVYLAIKAGILIYRIATKELILQKRVIKIISISAAAALVLLLILAQTPVVSSALSRLTGNSNSLSTRLSVWGRLLKGKNLFSYLLFGNGCTVVLDGKEIMPHNGHLYLIYAYGGIAYLLFMYVFFRKKKGMQWKDMLYLIPLFLCFSINVGLIDARFSFMMAQIIALGHAMVFPRKARTAPHKRILPN